jgi:tetratricopeptide (TPR) repeat protein
VSGRQSLELAFAREAWLDVISWARQADEDGSLDELGVVRAVVALTRLPRTSVFRSDLETWLRCGSGLSLNALPAAEQRAFLAAWGRLGRLATQHQVVAPAAHQYRAWFLYGCQQWPDEELLWVWLADASPEKECEVVLRQGLARNPESGILRRSLGEVLYRWGRFAEALTFWSEAIDRRAADLEVLAKAFRLAVQCSKATQADRLRRQILSSAPKDHSELIALIRFAREQGDISRALGLTEEGLADDPLDEALIKWKAQILFDQRKFELLLEHLKQMREEPDLLLLRGTAHYELGDYTRAARDLFGAITGGQSVPLAWLNLARSYDRLGHRHQALQALETARRQYPTDEPLRRLETSLRQVGG